MIEKIIGLIERIAIALEVIAGNRQPATVPLPATDVTPAVTAATVVSKPAEPPVVGSSGPIKLDYTQMSYDVLKQTCEARGFQVPPRTKTPTLIKWLNEFDGAQVKGKVVEQIGPKDAAPGMVVTKETGVTIIEKPFLDPPPVEEADPFAEAVPASKKISRDDVMLELKRVQSVKGNPYVIELLVKYGNAQSFKDVKDDKLQAIYDEAKKVS